MATTTTSSIPNHTCEAKRPTHEKHDSHDQLFNLEISGTTVSYHRFRLLIVSDQFLSLFRKKQIQNIGVNNGRKNNYREGLRNPHYFKSVPERKVVSQHYSKKQPGIIFDEAE